MAKKSGDKETAPGFEELLAEAEVLAEGQRAAGAIYDKFRAGGPV